jgi:hypothetical protein
LTQGVKGAVVAAMAALAYQYRQRFGESPLGYVMGVKDFRVLRTELGQMGRSGEITQLHGLPIYFKISSGIELLVHQQYAERILDAQNLTDRLDLLKGGIIT